MHIKSESQPGKAFVYSPTRFAWCGAFCFALLSACTQPPKAVAPKKPAPPPSSSAVASEPPPKTEPALPVVSATALAVEEVPALQELTLLRRGQDGAFELLEYALPESFAIQGWASNDELRIEGTKMPYAFTSQNAERPGALPNELWVRRPLKIEPQQLNGDCYTPAYGNGTPGKHYRFHAPAAEGKLDPKTQNLWLEALANHFEHRRGPFYGYAAGKLRERLPKPKRGSRAYYDDQRRTDIAELIGTNLVW